LFTRTGFNCCQQANALIQRGLPTKLRIGNDKRPRLRNSGCSWFVPYPDRTIFGRKSSDKWQEGKEQVLQGLKPAEFYGAFCGTTEVVP